MRKVSAPNLQVITSFHSHSLLHCKRLQMYFLFLGRKLPKLPDVFCLEEERFPKLPDVFCLKEERFPKLPGVFFVWKKKGCQNSLCFCFCTWRTCKTPIGPVYFCFEGEAAKLPVVFCLRKKGYQNSLCF